MPLHTSTSSGNLLFAAWMGEGTFSFHWVPVCFQVLRVSVSVMFFDSPIVSSMAVRLFMLASESFWHGLFRLIGFACCQGQ